MCFLHCGGLLLYLSNQPLHSQPAGQDAAVRISRSVLAAGEAMAAPETVAAAAKREKTVGNCILVKGIDWRRVNKRVCGCVYKRVWIRLRE